MKSSSLQSTRKKSVHEWVGAIGTLLILSGIYVSMDNFASYAGPENISPPKPNTTLSVASPYWNETLGYGFRSVAGDGYEASGTTIMDVVSVKKTDASMIHSGEVKVSYYKDTPIEIINASIHPDSPRAYSRLAHGIAVIEGDLDSARAKTIFSTLHSD